MNVTCLAPTLLLLGNLAAIAAARASAETQRYLGACDASAGAALDNHRFAIASDNDNSLRIYDSTAPGGPVETVDLNRFLGATRLTQEADIEGAARIGDRVYWIGSHSRNKQGRPQSNRRQFFATDIVREGTRTTLHPAGSPYHRLVEDLSADPRLASFKLGAAAALPPDHPGALNIEGLSATPEGQLLIGFRNPIPGGRALVIPVLNPTAIIEGQRARLGEPLLPNLGGLGIRDLALVGRTYWILAGAYDEGGVSKLYRWAGGTNAPVAVPQAHLKHLNPEALVVFPGQEMGPFHVLSDDGSRTVNGRSCKDVKDPMQRQFRAVWVQPDL